MNILVITSCRAALNSIRPEVEIFCGLARAGHQVTMLTKAEDEKLKVLQDAGIKIIEGEPLKKICFDTIGLIRKELKAKDYDIVYATNSKAIPNAGFACIGFKVKLVAYRGTTGGLYRHDPTAYLTILHPRVDGVICVSDAVREDIQQRVWKNKNQVVTIYKGHNLDWYKDIEPADYSEFQIQEGEFTAICAVNARPSKGIDVMLKACDLLCDLDNFHLILAGKNMDGEPYQQLIAESKMKKRIHQIGYRLDVPSLVKSADILVQPSVSGEGLPRAVMEAMGIGTPVIATTTGGGKEIIEDGQTGFIIPVRSPEAIAEKIRILYKDRKLAKKMADESLEKIGGELSTHQTVKNHEDYFTALLKGVDYHNHQTDNKTKVQDS